MYYGKSIKQMMEFILYMYKNKITTTTNTNIKFSYYKHHFIWDGHELTVKCGISIMRISVNLSKRNENNYISVISKRLNIQHDNSDFYTFISPEITIKTKELCEDDGLYFQYSLFSDLPDYEEILDIFNTSNLLIQNNVSYFGSYKIPKFNMKKIITKIIELYPETKDKWEEYLQ